MENKSRVIKYADLRKQISNMDVYSFEDTPTTKKKLPESSAHSTNSQVVEKKYTDGIKRNTLSLSIDELVKEHEAYDSNSQRRETKHRYKAMKRGEHKPFSFSLSNFAWLLLIILCLVIAVLIVLVFTGVFK